MGSGEETGEQLSAREKERKLFERYREDPTERNLQAIIDQYERLVYKIAQKYHRGGPDFEDIVQVGMKGLWLAIQRFDLSKGNRFTTYAYQTVQGEILRYFRDRKWTMKVPRSLKNRCMKIYRLRDELSKKLGQSPTAEQLAEESDYSEEEVLEALELGSAYHPATLIEGVEADRVSQISPGDDSGTTEQSEVHRKMYFDQILSGLTEREEKVLRLRYKQDMTQQEVADIIGVSQMYVSRLQRKALEKLRNTLDPEQLRKAGLL